MSHVFSVSRFIRLAPLLLAGWFSQLQAVELPTPLEPWREWIEHQIPQADCPLLPQSEERLCFWPGAFEFAVTANAARFSGSVTTFGETSVPLPGSSLAWPQQVEVDGQAVAVVAANGQPQVRLPRGKHQLSGLIEFERRPEELPLPGAYVLIALTLDGQPVEQVRRTPGGLWLGRPEETGTPKADSLQLEVYRLLADGLPPRLVTHLKVNVSGRAREQRLGPVMPPGFALISIESPLNARQEGNDLILQLRPGAFEINLTGRALAPLDELALALGNAPWPEVEIWSYSPNPAVRESNAAGPEPIDPAQAGVPGSWHSFASFLMDGSAPLKLEIGGRGLDLDEPNRLHLQRNLWLSFDATRWLAKDNISGQMRSDWRLDAQPPFVLTRAAVNGEPVLVTGSDAATGIEVRSPQPRIEASAEAGFTTRLPALGWQQDFESASLTLQLPPGWRLLDVGGADRVDAAWSNRFQLSTVLLFVVLVVLAWRFGGIRFGLLALLLAALGFGEYGDTSSLLVGLLVLGLIARFLPAGRLKRIGTLFSWSAWLLCALMSLPFLERQLTLALYPQLERADLSGYQARQASALDLLADNMDVLGGMADSMYLSKQVMAPPPPPPEPAPMAAPATAMAMAMESNVMADAAPQAQRNVSKFDNFEQRKGRQLERYSAGTNVQAGNAEPDWRWNGYQVYFDGRVTPDTELRPWLIAPWLMSAWRLLAVLSCVSLLWWFARQLKQHGALPTGQRWLLTATALLLVGTPVMAADLPDEEWLERMRQRLLEAPPCHASGCAGLARAEVLANGEGVTVLLQAHAEALSSLALPQLTGHSWTAVSLDASPAALQRYNDQIWIALAPGVHQIELRAQLEASDVLRLRFPLAPMRVRCQGQGWLCSGINEGRMLSDTLELTPELTTETSASGRPAAAPRSSIAPFVQVERDFTFELDWVIETTVRRVAPLEGGVTVQIAVLEGEQLISEGLELKDGKISVSIQPGASHTSFTTRIEPVEGLELLAAAWSSYSEIWRLRPGPAWHLSYEGVPPVQPEYAEEEWVHTFFPLPGETLRLAVDRPKAAPGSTLAIDTVNLSTRAGNRQQDSTLSLSLRATQGGQHTLKLPDDAELTAVRMDGTTLNSKLRDAVLSLPIKPGSQMLVVEFRQNLAQATVQALPAVDLRAPVSNINLSYVPAPKRWLLWASGPQLGPALLFWPTLLVLLIAVLILKRFDVLPVSLVQGLLLALGAALVFWPLLPLWLLLVAAFRWRLRHGGRLRTWAFRAAQLALLGLTAVVVLTSLAAIGTRLSGGADMQVAGLNSSQYALNWFADLAPGPLPAASVVSVPQWLFQALLLLWAVWFGWRLFGWLREGWRAFRADGWLRPASAGSTTATPAPAADSETPEQSATSGRI